jgi:hypothetical protein
MPVHLRFIVLMLAAGLILPARSAPLSAQERSGAGNASVGQTIALSAQPGPQETSPQFSATPSGRSPAAEEQTGAAETPTGIISGTVKDTQGDVVPGARVILEGVAAADRRTATANESGGFEFNGLKPGVPYHVTVSANGFSSWNSSLIVLSPGHYQLLTKIRLVIEGRQTSITVNGSSKQIAVEEVHAEEQQQILGFIPNYYVAYNKDAAPLPAKLKYELALKLALNPSNFVGVAIMAGITQAGDTPDDPLGARGYGERLGTVYTDGFTDLMFGSAILPSLLHQDPRYFYQGTGTVRSRLLHALSYTFMCRGDNGRMQVNYSSMGGDVISSAISNAYYPPVNRGVGPMFESIGVNTAERTFSAVMQEFVLRRLTPKARRTN